MTSTDPADMRPLQSPTADEIARIRAALPTGTPSMKGKWESMETAPRDGRPVWCRSRAEIRVVGNIDYTGDDDCRWMYHGGRGFIESSGSDTCYYPSEWFNPEVAP